LSTLMKNAENLWQATKRIPEIMAIEFATQKMLKLEKDMYENLDALVSFLGTEKARENKEKFKVAYFVAKVKLIQSIKAFKEGRKAEAKLLQKNAFFHKKLMIEGLGEIVLEFKGTWNKVLGRRYDEIRDAYANIFKLVPKKVGNVSVGKTVATEASN